MIFDHIDNYKLYTGCNPKIKIALEFLYKNKDNLSLSDGEYILDDKNVIAYIVSKHTILKTEAKLEIHKKNIDIHYILDDMEICGLSPLQKDKLSEYDEKQDIAFLDADIDSSYVLAKAGYFYIVWPNEPHRPLCAVNDQVNAVRKIIVKVKV